MTRTPASRATMSDDEELLTSWEANFLLSTGSQDYPLTPAQQEKLDEIDELLWQRRAALRNRRNR